MRFQADPLPLEKRVPEQEVRAQGMSARGVEWALSGIQRDAQSSVYALNRPHERASGAVQRPLVWEEKNALVKMHDFSFRKVHAGAPVFKGYKNSDVGNILYGKAVFEGQVVPFNQMRGYIGLARNTQGLTASETIARLGLDHEHAPHSPEFKGAAKGQFTDVDAHGWVTVSEEIKKNGFHYVEQPMSVEQAAQAKVPVGQDLFDHAQQFSSNPERYKRVPRENGQDNPYTGTGMSSSNSLVDKKGRSFPPAINQELLAGQHPFLPGAKLKVRSHSAGSDQTVAHYRPVFQDGKPLLDTSGQVICRWELDPHLTPKQRAYYEGLIAKARHDVHQARAHSHALNAAPLSKGVSN